MDDDEIARQTGVNRHYVNTLCRVLHAEGMITRQEGSERKLVNALIDQTSPAFQEIPPRSATVPRVAAKVRRSDNLTRLVEGFAGYVSLFEERQAFPGPSLYFHERAIERRRTHATAASLVADRCFLEYVYAVLPSWGMHRMGTSPTKVNDFLVIQEALQEAEPLIDQLWPLSICNLTPDQATAAAGTAWSIIARLHASTSNTQIVAGSKTLHHVLPDLVPPIDRQYTFQFMTGQKAVTTGDQRAFLDWFPLLTEVGAACRQPIDEAIERGGFMATSRSKVIDNAIMGFMQSSKTRG